MKSLIFGKCSIIIFFLAVGCMSWEPGWKQAAEPAVKGDAVVLLAKAEKLENTADTKEKVQALIAAYEDVLKADPRNIEALSSLGGFYYLMGYGYSASIDEKKQYYMKGVNYAERAMYTNKDFRKRADVGENVWQACTALTKREMYAMYFYFNCAGMLWSETLGFPGKLLNLRWVTRGRTLLERMSQIDPEWRAGSVYNTWAGVYALTPGIAGGDVKKAEEYYNKSIKAGPKMINFYVNRAQYLHRQMKNREAFIADLKYAAAIDPHDIATMRYPFAAYYKRNAGELLAKADEYFK
jgi:tetratricopeptide (TPR) repeat protein